MNTGRKKMTFKILILFVVSVLFLLVVSTYDPRISLVPAALQSGPPARNQLYSSCSENIMSRSENETKNKIFCEASHLGCYKMQKTVDKQVVVVIFRFMTSRWCVAYCQSNLKTYAVVNANKCMCSNNVYHITVTEKPSTNCNEPCGGNKKETCGGDDSADVHFIRGLCERAPFSEEFAASRYKGCFVLPKHHHSLKFYGETTSTSQCLLVCEQERHPLAVMCGQTRCLCGRMTSSFNLTHKVDSMSCNTSESARVYRTMFDDERCSRMKLLPPGRHNRTLLASFPGSGNTWTRFLLERATGYYTGSVYNDPSLTKIGYLGERYAVNSGLTDMIKEHFLSKDPKAFPHLQAAILVIRNPFRAFVALGKFATGGHVGTPSEKVLNKTIQSRLAKWNNHWKSMLTRILKANMTLKVIYFEDMVADPISSVRKMVEFLPNPLLHPNDLEERLACLSQDTTGLAKRKSNSLSFNPFPKEWRKTINSSITEMRNALIKAGVKEELPLYENDLQFSL